MSGRSRHLCLFPLTLALAVTAVAGSAPGAAVPRSPSEDSGGALMPDEACYDVQACELDIEVFPEKKFISASAKVEVKVLTEMSELVLDLDPRLTVSRVRLREGARTIPRRNAHFERNEGKLRIRLEKVAQPSGRLTAFIQYSGPPREAVSAPWDGGFSWSKTKDGKPWIATSMQGQGADLWWPCKDHPSDRPESFTLRARVPRPLVVAANGRLVKVVDNKDDTRTFHWHTDYPINSYCVALNIAPYETITTNYTSVAGGKVPVTFWVLPENVSKGRNLLPELIQHLNFYERLLGPYPFRAEKYGVAETPFLGMEHQSIIAYGNRYAGGPHGYDWLHHHELGHEWWGNLVTAVDWRHFWLHEGLCTYMQALYDEEREGAMAYHHAMYEYRRTVRSQHALVPDKPTTLGEFDRTVGLDAYYKGAWVVHMLRYLIGKDQVVALLRRFAYPTRALEKRTDGSASRFVETEDFVKLACAMSGRDLRWFFQVYLTQPKLPKLVSEFRKDKLLLRWETPEGCPFPMPLEVEANGRTEMVPMPEGKAELDAQRYSKCRLDPQMWILKERTPVEVQMPEPDVAGRPGERHVSERATLQAP